MLNRIFRAIRLDKTVYEEIEAREDLDNEAWMIVGIIALVNGIIAAIVGASSGYGAAGFGAFISIVFLILVSYFSSVVSLYLVGTKLFGGLASFNEMRKVVAYAYAPYLLLSIPCVGFVAMIGFFITLFVAVRQTMDMSNGRTLVVVFVSSLFGAIPQLCIQTAGLSILGG